MSGHPVRFCLGTDNLVLFQTFPGPLFARTVAATAGRNTTRQAEQIAPGLGGQFRSVRDSGVARWVGHGKDETEAGMVEYDFARSPDAGFLPGSFLTGNQDGRDFSASIGWRLATGAPGKPAGDDPGHQAN